jgi:hypothetical protein
LTVRYIALQEREIHVEIAKARSDKPRGENHRKVDEAKQEKDEEGVVIEASGSGETLDANKKKRTQRKKVRYPASMQRYCT